MMGSLFRWTSAALAAASPLIAHAALAQTDATATRPAAPIELTCKGPYRVLFPQYLIILPSFDTYYIRAYPGKSQIDIKAERSDGHGSILSPKETDWVTFKTTGYASKATLDDGSRVTQHHVTRVSIDADKISLGNDVFATYDKSKAEVIGAGQGPSRHTIDIDLTTLTMRAEWKLAEGLMDQDGTYSCTGTSTIPALEQKFEALTAAKAEQDAAAAGATSQGWSGWGRRPATADSSGPVREACANGRMVRTTKATMLSHARTGDRYGAESPFVLAGLTVRTIRDEDAAAEGTCRIEFERGGTMISGRVPISDLAPAD